MGTREDIYDNEISPLMKQVLTICKRAGIPLVADFRIDDGGEGEEPLFCTSILPDHGNDSGAEHMRAVARAARPSVSHFAAFTITNAVPNMSEE